MQIEAVSENRKFRCFTDMVITEKGNLVGASLIGDEISVKAISASICERRNISFTREHYEMFLDTYSRKFSRPVPVHIGNHIYHTLCLDQHAFYKKYDEVKFKQRGDKNLDEQLNKNVTAVILAQDGDIKKQVGKYVRAKCTLPMEWVDRYHDMVSVTRLDTYVEDYSPWKNLQAVRVEFCEADVLKTVNEHLKTGRLVVPKGDIVGKFDSSWGLKQYLSENLDVFTEQLSANRPYFLPGTDLPDKRLLEMKRTPLVAQVNAIMGLYNYLKSNNSALLNGNMGTGKSIMSLGIAHLLTGDSKNKTVLLSAPELTLSNWHYNEILPALPWAKIRYLNSTTDAARYLRKVQDGYKPDGIEFVLVGTDRVKLGHTPWCAAVWRRMNGTKTPAWHCPNCFGVLPDLDADEDKTNDDDEDLTPASWYTLVKEGEKPSRPTGRPNGLPEGHKIKWNHKTKLKKCPHCQEVLWRPAIKSRGETIYKPRYAIYEILRKIKDHFSLLIVDELHKSRAQGSGRGHAFGQMVLCCDKVLGLTGTIVNGMASSYQQILWRTDPTRMLEEGFNHKTGPIAFAERYGTLEQIVRTTECDTGYHTTQKTTALQPKEKPGISPAMIQILADRSVNVDQPDLGLPLVEYKEIPVFLDMDDEHRKKYSTFHEGLFNVASSAARGGSKGAFAKFIPATINYADAPYLGANVEIGQNIIDADEFAEDYYHAKERWLVETVKKELAEKRRVIIYANYTDSYKIDQRIQDVLGAHGIHSRILKSSVKREKRLDWVEGAVKDGVEVIISNLQLLEVGLNILDFPTAIYYQLSYQDEVIRQGSRRAWRIQQHREVRIYYVVYNGSQQMAQFKRIMSRRAHALMIEGRIGTSEMADEFGRDENNALAQDLFKCMASKNDARKWSDMLAKDVDSNLEILSEERYRELQKKRFQQQIERSKHYIKTGEIIDAEFVEIEEPVEPVKAHNDNEMVAFHTYLTIAKQTKKRRGQKAIADNQLAFDFGQVS